MQAGAKELKRRRGELERRRRELNNFALELPSAGMVCLSSPQVFVEGLVEARVIR